jgi:hypothetical protein
MLQIIWPGNSENEDDVTTTILGPIKVKIFMAFKRSDSESILVSIIYNNQSWVKIIQLGVFIT